MNKNNLAKKVIIPDSESLGTQLNISIVGKKKYSYKKQSLYREIWNRLKTQPLAIASIAVIALMLLIAVFADVLYDYEEMCTIQNIGQKFLPASFDHFLGTDQFGRDQFARVIHGVRTALTLGVVASFLTTVVATTLASIAAYFGGKADLVIMRFIDIMSTVPAILLAIAICAGFGSGLWQLIIAIAVGSIAPSTMMIRSVAINVSKMEYIESAQALGIGTTRIILKYMCPNLMSMLIITFTAMIGHNIMMGATLSFIGLGVKSPQPEWGLMLNEAIPNMRMHINLIVGPAVGIVIATLSINTLGDCLRDAFDPQLKGK